MTLPPFDDIKHFMNAAWDGDMPGLDAFIQKYPGALEVTKGEPMAYTALMWAARSGQTESIETLLAHGAKIEARDMHGQTPLIIAAARGNMSATETLIKRGADIFATDEKGRNAADSARAAGMALTAALLDEAIRTRAEAQAAHVRAEQAALDLSAENFREHMRANARSAKFRLKGGSA